MSKESPPGSMRPTLSWRHVPTWGGEPKRLRIPLSFASIAWFLTLTITPQASSKRLIDSSNPHRPLSLTWLIIDPDTGVTVNSTRGVAPRGTWWPELHFCLRLINPAVKSTPPNLVRSYGFYCCPGTEKEKYCGGSGESFCRRWSCVTSNDGDWKWPISLQDRMTTFLGHICNNQGMAGKHVFYDCCNINNTASHRCFLLHKKDDAAYSDIFHISNPEQICGLDKENRMSVKERYIYEISRKHPFLYGPTILTMSACYKTAVQSCCQEENKTECFQIKLQPIKKYVREISLRHHHLCEIGIKFNHKVAKAVELVLLAKKLPKANFSEIAKLAMDIQSLHQICCEGNSVACVLGRRWLMNYICSKQAVLSSKFAPCCELPEPFRGECIITSENDDTPDLSPLPLSRFTEDPFICKQTPAKQDDSLQEFLYEYSRRHPELAVPVILRVDTVYQNLLGKCCKLENPLECYSHGEEIFQRVVHDSHERVKNLCDLREKLGDRSFHDRLIVLYTKKAPQLSTQELVVFTKNMAAAASKCCPLNDELQLACMEDSAKLMLGALCRRHETEPINAGVGHCCDDSYAFRKPCFDDLQVDGTYISPPLSCDKVINLKEDLCKAQEQEFQTEKQRFLSHLVKQKPHAAEMKFQSIIVDFAHLVERCCQAEKSEMCFQKEGSKLIEKCQSLLGS